MGTVPATTRRLFSKPAHVVQVGLKGRITGEKNGRNHVQTLADLTDGGLGPCDNTLICVMHVEKSSAVSRMDAMNRPCQIVQGRTFVGECQLDLSSI